MLYVNIKKHVYRLFCAMQHLTNIVINDSYINKNKYKRYKK